MKIRYTKGPDEVALGSVVFKRGEAREISDEMAAQALLPQRVAEYGFEQVGAIDETTGHVRAIHESPLRSKDDSQPAPARRAPKTEPIETNQE